MMALINPPKRPQHLADDKMSLCTTQAAFPKTVVPTKALCWFTIHAVTMLSYYFCVMTVFGLINNVLFIFFTLVIF